MRYFFVKCNYLLRKSVSVQLILLSWVVLCMPIVFLVLDKSLILVLSPRFLALLLEERNLLYPLDASSLV